jgi:DNA-binding NarL/FixJ family response regulator
MRNRARIVRPREAPPEAIAAARKEQRAGSAVAQPRTASTGELALIAPAGLLTDALARSLSLLNAGIQVRRCTLDPADAELAEARLILLDLDIPGGEAVLASVHARTAAPIVVLVPAVDHPTGGTCMSRGAVAWVSKTFSEARTLEVLRKVLDTHAAAPAQAAAGSALSGRKQASGASGRNRSLHPYGLTDGEMDVLRLLAEGLTNLHIAQRRGSTEGTVKIHLDKIYKKLGVQNRTQAILIAERMESLRDMQLQCMDQQGFRIEWFLPYTQAEMRRPGEVLFHKGDAGDALYYIHQGRVALVELGLQLGDGSVLGEIGIFSPEHQRTSTAQCDAETRLFRLSAEQARRLYIENPHFAYHVLRLISGRLIADRDRPQTVH